MYIEELLDNYIINGRIKGLKKINVLMFSIQNDKILTTVYCDKDIRMNNVTLKTTT